MHTHLLNLFLQKCSYHSQGFVFCVLYRQTFENMIMDRWLVICLTNPLTECTSDFGGASSKYYSQYLFDLSLGAIQVCILVYIPQVELLGQPVYY